jgi:hypothetical protein
MCAVKVKRTYTSYDLSTGTTTTTKHYLFASTKYKLYPGGKAKLGRKNLFKFEVSATNYSNYPGSWDNPLTAEAITSGLYLFGRSVGSDGRLYKVFPDGVAGFETRIVALGCEHYGATVTPKKMQLQVTELDYKGTGIRPMKKDDGQNFGPNCVVDEEDHITDSAPALYVSGSRMQTETTFQVKNGANVQITIRGKATGGAIPYTF